MSPSPDETSPSADPTDTGTPAAPPAFVYPTDIPDSVLLPSEELLQTVRLEPERQESEGLVPWEYAELLDGDCNDGAVVPAAAMRRVEAHAPEDIYWGIQQVAVFDSAAAAKAEFDNVAAQLAACEKTGGTMPDSPDQHILYTVEPLALGDQALGLVADYASVFLPEDTGDDAIGRYFTVVRRGNAMTFIWLSGGETTVGEARALVVERTERAAPLLCRYDESCSA